MIVLGLGMTISVAPLTTVVMGTVEERFTGTASGINNAVARIAGMLAVALLGALSVGLFSNALDTHLAELSISPEIGQALLADAPNLTELHVPSGLPDSQRSLVEAALGASFLYSFRIVMLIAAMLGMLSAICAFFTIAPKAKD
jgi:hypothetical protein